MTVEFKQLPIAPLRLWSLIKWLLSVIDGEPSSELDPLVTHLSSPNWVDQESFTTRKIYTFWHIPGI
jgi:hypothetical protein